MGTACPVGTTWEAGGGEPASSDNQSRRLTRLGNDKFQMHCFKCCENEPNNPDLKSSLWALTIANFLTNRWNWQFCWTLDGSIAMMWYYIYTLMFWGWLVSISSLGQLFRNWSGLMLFMAHIGRLSPLSTKWISWKVKFFWKKKCLHIGSKEHSWEYVGGGL